MPNTIKRVSPLLVMVCLIASGCALIKLNEDVKEAKASTVLVGRISTGFPGNGPIVVAACSQNRGKREVAHYSVLHDFGEYELMVAKGKYYVFAFWDKNGNLVYDAGEPAGQHGGPRPVPVRAPAGGIVGEIDINIPEQGRTVEVPIGFEISPEKPGRLRSRQAGVITDLDDELFAEEYGVKGFWEGLSFFKEIGGNIFFLEPYDPDKIPVLFIHGATGTPKGWKYFVDSMDRTRFQPWFFYYPSGIRIPSTAALLNWKLSNLQRRYNFTRLYIVAHSMGGLVARSFLMDYAGNNSPVKLFISMATPWGGDRMAEYGVRQSPAVIPCWIDLQPESDFIKSLYRTTLPEGMDFYMFYGHRGSRNPFRTNNDGTIAMSSLLDPRPQAEAKMNYAFNEDHASIIYSKAAAAQLNSIINTYYEQGSASLHASGGRIELHFSFDDPVLEKTFRSALILQPEDRDDAATVISLDENSSGKTIGPFPPGDYIASLVSEAAITEKPKIPVTIAGSHTSELHFALIADGFVAGYVTSAAKPEEWIAGMPVEKITPKSISLRGAGIDRIIYPFEGEETGAGELFIRREDFFFNGTFRFFGLPEGEYELTVEAEGYHPLVKHYSVTPGRMKDVVNLELIPRN